MDLNSQPSNSTTQDESSLQDLRPIPRLGPGTKVLQPFLLEEVAIVGMGPTGIYWLQRAYVDLNKLPQMWTINSGCRALKSDLNFSMHTKATMEGMEPEEVIALGKALTADNRMDVQRQQMRLDFNAKLHESLGQSGTPQVTLDGADDSFEYPFAEVVETFQSAYLQNGVAYMMAFALLCGVKKISLYGCDYDFRTPGSAYEAGRACVEYWIGRCHERGVGIVLPDKSNLQDMQKIGQLGMYGFGYQQPQFGVRNGKVVVEGFMPLPKKEDLVANPQ